MPTPPSQALADTLKGDAPRFNARFARAAAAMPRLDAAVFAAFLREKVAPVVDAVAAEQPDRIAATVEGLYRVALQTAGRELPLRYPGLDRLWSLLAALPGPISFDAAAVATMTVNVYCNVADTPGARPEQFLDELERLAPAIAMARELRQALLILAWRAGYSQAREDALAACVDLPSELASVALCPLLQASDANHVARAVERLRGDAWLRPQHALLGDAPAKALRIAGRAGGFRGFGGPFLAPPTVTLHDGRFVLTDGASWWALATDVFGTTLRRLDHAPATPAQPNSTKWSFTRDGVVKRGGQEIRLDLLADALSWAADDTTLVATTALSHRAYVIASV